MRYDDEVQVTERASLPEPTTEPGVLDCAAQRLLDRSGWETDGRGVTLVGVLIPLPRPRPGGRQPGAGTHSAPGPG